MTQTEWRETFANNLSDILKEKGMSQRQLAIDSDVSVSMISDYINGNKVPGLITAINMAYALDMSLDELYDLGERVKWG